MSKAANKLMRWYRQHGRHDLPWRESQTPYRVLVSELMLQQTQVSRVIDFFERWMTRFPSLGDLANSNEEAVLKQWQGLGYYRRARALKAIADSVEALPVDAAELRALPGIGPYTAEAIRAFAHDLPAHPIDTNLKRVLSRVLGSDSEEEWQATLDAWQKRRSARALHSALMDFGSLVCSARSPKCESCPLRKECASFAANGAIVGEVKARKVKAKTTLAIGVMREGKQAFLTPRGGILRVDTRETSFRPALQGEAKKRFGVEIAVRPACATIELDGEIASVHRCSLLLGDLGRFAPMDEKRLARASEFEKRVLAAAGLAARD